MMNHHRWLLYVTLLAMACCVLGGVGIRAATAEDDGADFEMETLVPGGECWCKPVIPFAEIRAKLGAPLTSLPVLIGECGNSCSGTRSIMLTTATQVLIYNCKCKRDDDGVTRDCTVPNGSGGVRCNPTSGNALVCSLADCHKADGTLCGWCN